MPAFSKAICYCVIGTTDVGAEFGDVRPLDENRMRTLTVNGVQLLDRIVADTTFLSDLAAVDCITLPQKEHLINITQPRDRNDKLLEFLTRRSVADFQKFTRVLAKDQAHLVPLFVTDGGETALCVSKTLQSSATVDVTCPNDTPEPPSPIFGPFLFIIIIIITGIFKVA